MPTVAAVALSHPAGGDAESLADNEFTIGRVVPVGPESGEGEWEEKPAESVDFSAS